MFVPDKLFLALLLQVTRIVLTSWKWVNECWKNWWSRKAVLGPRDVPGPVALPYFGTKYMFTMFGKYGRTEIHKAYEDMEQKYGPLVKEEALSNIPVISVYSREYIDEVLRSKPKYPIRPVMEVVSYYRSTRPDRYSSLGLVNEQGENWHKLRSAFVPKLMSVDTIQGFYPTLNGVANDFMEFIRVKRQDSRIENFEEIAYRVGLETNCTLMLGKRLGFLKPNTRCETIMKLAEAGRVGFESSRDTFYCIYSLWKYFPTKTYKQLVESEETIYEIISHFIEETLKEQEGTAQDQDIEAVFNSILRQNDFDMNEKKATIVDFISAGIHTLGNTVMFLLHMLGRNPEVQQKLYEEVLTLAPSGCDIDWTQMKNGVYLDAFIMETYRLTPTIPCIARVTQEPVTLGDYHFPPGSVLLVQSRLACLKEDNFKDALKCVPERWLPNSEIKPHASSLVKPFGHGRRICPANKFVDKVLKLLLAKVLMEFEVVAEHELEISFEYILVPKSPMSLVFRERRCT